jgi:hypothetical protein
MASTRNGSTRAWRRARARVVRSQSCCSICGELVDKSLRWPDPMSASVDHVDPLAMGGADLDPGNHALAHLGCNSRKGTGAPRIAATSGSLNTTRAW